MSTIDVERIESSESRTKMLGSMLSTTTKDTNETSAKLQWPMLYSETVVLFLRLRPNPELSILGRVNSKVERISRTESSCSNESICLTTPKSAFDTRIRSGEALEVSAAHMTPARRQNGFVDFALFLIFEIRLERIPRIELFEIDVVVQRQLQTIRA